MKLAQDRALIQTANRTVPMAVACRLGGMRVPEGNRKTHCPVEETEHPDQGAEPAFRVYARDAWCFACQSFWTPTKIFAHLEDVTEDQAAVKLLEHVGYRPANFAHLWRDAVKDPEPDQAALQQALRNFCAAADPGWDTHRLEAGVAEYLAQCFRFLVQVKNAADAARWLELSQQVMGSVLARRADDRQDPGARSGGLDQPA